MRYFFYYSFLMQTSFLWGVNTFAIHKAQKEKSVLMEITSLYQQKNYQACFEKFKNVEKQYSASLQITYYGGLCALYLPSNTLTEARQNTQKGLSLLNKVKKKIWPFRTTRLYRKWLVNLLHYSGMGYFFLGTYVHAISDLTKATKLDDTKANIYFNLGMVYETIHNFVEANRAYARYYKLITAEEEEF
ncbi:MAG: hypothetical protein D6767_10850 [Candidatus Hydrogenedentota bacterium]|nr:MAG: hypothetical protein D6767_10850 [Candidatus Hydrogenedentota bacterium]